MSTTTTDAQTWVWPPAGAAAPPIAATGNIGPIHMGDSMILEWTPATNPEIDLTCISESGIYTNTFAAKLASSPLTFPFKDTAKTNGTERIFCHFFFNPSVLGNTVTWEFVNEASSKAVIWSRNEAITTSSKSSSSTTTTTSGISSTSISSSSATNSQTSTTTKSSPSSTSSTTITTSLPTSSGLSSGAGAGIGVGVAVVVLGLAALAFLLLRKKKKSQNAIAELPNSQAHHEKDGYAIHEKGQPDFVSAELEGSPTVHQLP